MKRGYADGDPSGPMKKPRSDKSRARLLISSRVAGCVIGKGGSNIQKLRTDNNATVRVPDCPGPERVMTIEADDEDAIIAVLEQSLPLMAEEAVKSRPGREPATGAGSSGLEVRLLVHQSVVGGVIGKSGSKIKEIREATGASIKVYQTCAPQSTERVVSIQGAPEKIVSAVNLVFQVLAENETKGANHPYDPINFDGFYSSEYGGFATESDVAGFGGPPKAPVGMRGSFGGPPGGFGGPPGGFRGGRGGGGFGVQRGGGFGGGPRVGFADIDFGFGGGKPSGGLDDDSGEKDSTQVTIPKDMAGAIIGPGGSRIRKIRSDSRASITIEEASTDGNERVITIAGTQKQIQMAQYLLQQSVREHGSGGGPAAQQGFGGRGRF
jgi:heterogeneous nuclear ribonucleoprotein K